MKVLMTTETFFPSVGGIESHIQSLGRSLGERGHEVVVCTIIQKGLRSFEQVGNARVYRLEGLFQKIPLLHRNPGKKTHPPAHDFIFSRGLRDIIIEEKPDIVHAHDWTVYSVLPLKKQLKIPVVLTIHGYHFICPNKSLMRGNIICERSGLTRCIGCMHSKSGLIRAAAAYLGIKANQSRLNDVDKFIPVSRATGEIHIQHLRLKHPDMVVIPNFFKIADLGDTPPALDLPQDFILFVGNLHPQKGVELLIEAYHRLKTGTKLVLIGYKHHDYHYGSGENVVFVENAPRSFVLSAMSRCRFAVFPSLLPEAFGIVAIEAMSQKKAVIATAVGGLKDVVIDGQNGFSVPPNDVKALSAAMQQLLDNPALAKAMGERGYLRYLENYTPESVVPGIIKEYENLLPR